MTRRLFFLLGIVLVFSSPTRAQEIFDIPLRINMGGPEIVDSRGRTWLGDQIGAGDALGVRPNDLGGTNTLTNWCVPKSPDTINNFGFDANDANDVALLTSLRWDVGADTDNYDLEFSVPNGEYIVSLYFFECCCPQRHFQIEIQGEVVMEGRLGGLLRHYRRAG